MKKPIQLLLAFVISVLASIIWGTINYSYLCRLVRTNNSDLDQRLLLDQLFPTHGPMYQCNQFEIVITPILLVVLTILFLYLLHVYWNSKSKNRIECLKNYLYIVSANIIFGFAIMLLVAWIPHLSSHFMDSYSLGLKTINVTKYLEDTSNQIRVIESFIIQIVLLHFGVYLVSLFNPFINKYIKNQYFIYTVILVLSILILAIPIIIYTQNNYFY